MNIRFIVYNKHKATIELVNTESYLLSLNWNDSSILDLLRINYRFILHFTINFEFYKFCKL